MVEINPKKINIKTDIPTGKIITPDPKPLPIEMPPPPNPDNISRTIQKSAPQKGLPPLPNGMKPIIAQQNPVSKEFSSHAATPKQAFPQQPPVACPPIPPQPIPKMAAAQEQFPTYGVPAQHKIETIEVPKEPVHDPLQKEIKRRISQVKGPVFISLERYREVKDLLYSLKENSRDLRAIMDEFKGNKKEGTELLSQSVDKLEHIEENIENINATLRT